MKRAVLSFILAIVVTASAASVAFAQYRTDGFIGPGAGSQGGVPMHFDRTIETGGG